MTIEHKLSARKKQLEQAKLRAEQMLLDKIFSLDTLIPTYMQPDSGSDTTVPINESSLPNQLMNISKNLSSLNLINSNWLNKALLVIKGYHFIKKLNK